MTKQTKNPRKPYCFIGSFKLIVFAASRAQAWKHIKREAISVVAYRSLKYAGSFEPSDKESWVASVV